MNRKLIFLNLVLLALAASLGWLLRVRWIEARAHERAIFDRAARHMALLPPPSLPPPRPVTPSAYIDVAQNMLFAKDRSPNVIIDAPPPAPPPPPMPPLPLYHGQMAIGDPVVILSSASNAPQKRYRAGEKVGPFEVVNWDRERITLDWNGKIVEKKLEELAPKETPAAQQAAPAAATVPAPAAAAVSLAPAPAATSLSNNTNPALGVDMGGGFRACATNDNSPAGTVIDGYKKVVAQTPMGKSCHWEPVNK